MDLSHLERADKTAMDAIAFLIDGDDQAGDVLAYLWAPLVTAALEDPDPAEALTLAYAGTMRAICRVLAAISVATGIDARELLALSRPPDESGG